MTNTEQLIREIAAKHDAKLRTVMTDAELRANDALIDQILVSLGTLTWSKKS